MITTDIPLLQAVLRKPPSLQTSTAIRLNHFLRHSFNPKSPQSLDTADKLWRATLYARDAGRLQS